MIESLHQEFYKDEWIPVILPHDRDVPLATLQLWTFPPMNWSVETGPFDCAPRFLECVVNVSIRLIYTDCIWNCVGLIWYIQVISAVVLLPAPNMATLLRVISKASSPTPGDIAKLFQEVSFPKGSKTFGPRKVLKGSPSGRNQWHLFYSEFFVAPCDLTLSFAELFHFCMTGGSNHQKQKDWPWCWFGQSGILAVTIWNSFPLPMHHRLRMIIILWLTINHFIK